MKVITNNNWRNFCYRDEVPEKVLQNDFDWTKDDFIQYGDYADGFFQYKGTWYHIDEFMANSYPFNGVPLDCQKNWDAFYSDTFFSGVAIKISDDGEQYQIALVLS